MANLIQTLVELKLDLLTRKGQVKSEMESRKAAPIIRKTVKRQEIVLMNRSNLAVHPLAPVSEIVGNKIGRGATLAKKAIETAREERAAQRKFVSALFNFLGFWEACSLSERATMAKKASTASRARLIASDVLAAPVVETTVETTNRPRWAHVVVKAETSPQQRAAMARKGNQMKAAAQVAKAWKQVTADQVKAAKLALQQKRSAVMAVVSAIFGLLAEKRAIQAQVDWHFGIFSRSVAFDITVELRARIQDINGQIDPLVLGLTSADMRFLSFKAYRMVVSQVKAAAKRAAKADAAFWRQMDAMTVEDTIGDARNMPCTFGPTNFAWSLGEVLQRKAA